MRFLKLRFYGYVLHREDGKVCFVLVQAADLSDALYFGICPNPMIARVPVHGFKLAHLNESHF